MISVIIPTHDRAHMLEDALKSIRAQTYQGVEIIVVDDGSMDQTKAVVDNFRENNSDLHVVYIYQSRQGVSAARNAGLRASRGEFIQYLDSDDFLHSRKLELQFSAFRSRPSSELVISRAVCFYDQPTWLPIESPRVLYAKKENEYLSTSCTPPFCLYRRALCDRVGPWCALLSAGEDVEYQLRSLLRAQEILYVSGELYGYRQHQGGRVTDNFSGALGCQREILLCNLIHERMKSILETDKKLTHALSLLYHRAIRYCFIQKEYKLADLAIKSAWRLPMSVNRRFKLAVWWIVSLSPGIGAALSRRL